jgi:hypothetical protein
VYSQGGADSLAITVTPPLIQLTIGPGEKWSSSLKVVNNNTYDIPYYAEVVDFEAEGEHGRSSFTPILEIPEEEAEFATRSLARWITLSPEPTVVQRGMSGEIPFTVQVPENAEPGGHYAAILIGTQPNSADEAQGPSVKISTRVSSLIFVRIRGDVVEEGRIREFRSEKSLYQTPEAELLLRFENLGNVHLQPQGDITIYNMWGKERGRVLINQKTNFGNVLPNSIRKFQFSWKGEHNPFDIGRYSAIVTLAYGSESKRNISATNYFWVIPVIPVLVGLTVVVSFGLLLVWFIRRYIRRALTLERARLGDVPTAAPSIQASVPISTIGTLMAPLKEGVIDLRSVARRDEKAAHTVDMRLKASPATRVVPAEAAATKLTFGQFASKYALFFAFLLIVLVSAFGTWWYFEKVLVPTRSYEITEISAEEDGVNTQPDEQVGE